MLTDTQLLKDLRLPLTLTPYARKPAAAKGRATMRGMKVKVNVHDCVALRSLTISTSEPYLEVLERVAMVMKRPNNRVEIVYEAPWSSKIGAKKALAYISNEDELDDFWLAYGRYVKKQENKKMGRREEARWKMHQ